MSAQIKVKQISGLQATLNALTGLDNIVETFTTNQTDGNTGITITYEAREADAIMVFVNGHRIQEGYSWISGGQAVTASSLEAGTELVWDASTVGYSLEANDEIQIQYETTTGGSVGNGGNGGASGTSGSSGTSGAAGAAGADGTSGSSGTSGSNATLGGTMTSSIIPDTNAQYDLGSAENKIRHLYLSDNSLNLGDQVISMTAGGNIQLPPIQIGSGDSAFNIETEEQFAKASRAAEEDRMIRLYNSKLRYACSSVWMRKPSTGEEDYVGSGQFISLDQDANGNPTDLNQGYFLTCAHNVFELTNTQHVNFNEVWISYNQTWWRQDPANIFYDAVADVCLIRTGIAVQAGHVLKLAEPAKEAVTGQQVWVCGFPSGYDTDSLSTGIVRDAHFNINDSGQAVDSLFLNVPAIGGNSGSAIIDADGDILGIYTFAYTAHETFGGGANTSVIRWSLDRLKTLVAPNHRLITKWFLGIDWARTGPSELGQNYFPVVDGVGGPILYNQPIQQGCRITSMAAASPLQTTPLVVGDIILGATLPGGTTYEFGYTEDQRTLGVLIYDVGTTGPVTLEYIQQSTRARLTTQFTPVQYGAVDERHDMYLEGGNNGFQPVVMRVQ